MKLDLLPDDEKETIRRCRATKLDSFQRNSAVVRTSSPSLLLSLSSIDASLSSNTRASLLEKYTVVGCDWVR